MNEKTGSKLCLNKYYIQAIDFLCVLKISVVIKKLFIFSATLGKLQNVLPFPLPCKQTFLEQFRQQENSKRERDWCHEQSPDGIAHPEPLYWNSLGFARLKCLTEPAWGSLLPRLPEWSHNQSFGAWTLWGLAFSKMQWLSHQRYWFSWGQTISTKLCRKRNLSSTLQVSLMKS